ncbi:MAG: CoA-binding protein [Vicinamibacterales bacterium]
MVVAIIGASSDRRKFGNKALRAFKHQGHTVIPVNPNETEVEGIPAVASVLDIPGPVNMATFYVQPEVGVRVLEEVARKGIQEVWLNPGADDDAVIAKAKALGIRPVVACSIIGVGESPYDY